MMEQAFDVSSQYVFTKDNAVVRVDSVMFYQVLDAAQAAYEVATLETGGLALIVPNILDAETFRTAILKAEGRSAAADRNHRRPAWRTIGWRVLHTVRTYPARPRRHVVGAGPDVRLGARIEDIDGTALSVKAVDVD